MGLRIDPANETAHSYGPQPDSTALVVKGKSDPTAGDSFALAPPDAQFKAKFGLTEAKPVYSAKNVITIEPRDHQPPTVMQAGGFTWAAVGVLAIAALKLGWKGLMWLLNRYWRDPVDTSNAIDLLFKTYDDVKKADGAREKFQTLYRGLADTIRVFRGKKKAIVEMHQDKAMDAVVQNWGETRMEFQKVQDHASEFYEKAIAGQSRLADLVVQVDLTPLIAGDLPEDKQAAVEHLLGVIYADPPNAALQSYKTAFRVLDQYLNAFILGDMLDDIKAAEDSAELSAKIESAMENCQILTRAITALLQATRKFLTIKDAIGSAYSVDMDINGEWSRAVSHTLIKGYSMFDAVGNHHSKLIEMAHEISEAEVNSGKKRTLDARVRSVSTVEGMIKHVVNDNWLHAGKKGVKINRADEFDNVYIPKDKQGPLFQILKSLTSNAVHFSKPSARRKDAFVNLKVEFDETTGALTFIVEDNGIGIKDLNAVIAGSRERPKMSCGEGLALGQIYDLANEKGIDIEYSRRSAKTLGVKLPWSDGSVFRVSFNINEVDGASPTPAPTGTRTDGGGLPTPRAGSTMATLHGASLLAGIATTSTVLATAMPGVMAL